MEEDNEQMTDNRSNRIHRYYQVLNVIQPKMIETIQSREIIHCRAEEQQRIN